MPNSRARGPGEREPDGCPDAPDRVRWATNIARDDDRPVSLSKFRRGIPELLYRRGITEMHTADEQIQILEGFCIAIGLGREGARAAVPGIVWGISSPSKNNLRLISWPLRL